MKCTMLAVLAICCFVFWSGCGYRLSSTAVVLIHRLLLFVLSLFFLLFFCVWEVGEGGILLCYVCASVL